MSEHEPKYRLQWAHKVIIYGISIKLSLSLGVLEGSLFHPLGISLRRRIVMQYPRIHWSQISNQERQGFKCWGRAPLFPSSLYGLSSQHQLANRWYLPHSEPGMVGRKGQEESTRNYLFHWPGLFKHRSFLHLAFLYINLRTAIRWEDGPSIVRHWKLWLPRFIGTGCKNYTAEAINLLAHLEADFILHISPLTTVLWTQQENLDMANLLANWWNTMSCELFHCHLHLHEQL
jgi:hypothetical protein